MLLETARSSSKERKGASLKNALDLSRQRRVKLHFSRVSPPHRKESFSPQHHDYTPTTTPFLSIPNTMPSPVESKPATLEGDPTMVPQELTLIVAATSKMGIGRGGTLPWTGLKKEMAYFARATKRASPGVGISLCQRWIARFDSFAEYQCCDYGSENLGEHTTKVPTIEGQNECRYYTYLWIEC